MVFHQFQHLEVMISFCSFHVQWNLPYPDLYYPDLYYPDLYYPDLYYLGTSIVRTAQIGHVACSLLTIMKFGLHESTRREPKGCCLPVWWLVYSTNQDTW